MQGSAGTGQGRSMRVQVQEAVWVLSTSDGQGCPSR